MGCIRFLLSPFAFLFGAVVMALVVFIGFAVAISVMGMPKAYAGEGWLVSDTFAAILLGLTFVGAIAGTMVARRMGGGLATLLMMAFAAYICLVPHADSPQDPSKSQRYAGRPESRPDNAGLVNLMRWSEDPSWLRYGGAVVGVTGAAIGASLAKGRRKASSSDDE